MSEIWASVLFYKILTETGRHVGDQGTVRASDMKLYNDPFNHPLDVPEVCHVATLAQILRACDWCDWWDGGTVVVVRFMGSRGSDLDLDLGLGLDLVVVVVVVGRQWSGGGA